MALITPDGGATQKPDDQATAPAPQRAERGGRGGSVSTVALYLRLGDVTAIALAGLAASHLGGTHAAPGMAANVTTLGAILMLLCGYMLSAYDSQSFFDLGFSLKSALAGWTMALSLMGVVGLSFRLGGVVDLMWLYRAVALSTAGLVTIRTGLWAWARHAHNTHRFDSRAVIVGAGPQGRHLYHFIRDNKWITVRVIGFVDDRRTRVPDMVDDIPVLGRVCDLIPLIRAGAVDQVLVSLPWAADQRVRSIIDDLAETPIKIRLAPDLAVYSYGRRAFSSLGGLPILDLFDRPISGVKTVLKAAEDYLIAGMLVILLSPLLALIALAIKLDSAGPVFFRQPREGFNNSTFMVWKFRTMRQDQCESDNVRQATRDDDRITRIGAILRRTSLDELPQLFNVLAGDMSLVGPRPHAASTRTEGVRFNDAVARYAARHRVKPGITGWAQVQGWRGETDTIEKLEHRLRHDLYYIDHWSVGFDLYILVRTALVVLGQKTAY